MSRLDQAHSILQLLQEESIQRPEFVQDSVQRQASHRVLTTLRDTISLAIGSVLLPGLTASAAITLLGIGACQELCQRFVLEYVCKYQQQNLNLIFLGRADAKGDNHMMVVIGDVRCDDALYVGRGSAPTTLAPDFVPIDAFFAAQLADSIFVDPLLTMLCNGPALNEQMQHYLTQHQITHVTGVRSYSSSPNFKKNAEKVRATAVSTAEQIRPIYLSLLTPVAVALARSGYDPHATQPDSAQKTSSPVAPGLFKTLTLDSLQKKYELPDQEQPSLEKGLRKAAANGQLEDLKAFAKVVGNINAADPNPDVKRTALHWAACKGRQDCYDALIGLGADETLQDAQGRTAPSLKPTAQASLAS